MPIATQTKLLRVLEQREFHRVGGEKPLKVDVRIVAATNQDLRQSVAMGEFRRDLYFRLNVLHIELPPLRERRDDVPVLVGAFVREASERHDRPFPGISQDAMLILRDYAWPGNVRELRNLVESMVVLAPGRTIEPRDIPAEVLGGRGRTLLPAPVPHAVERAGEGRSLRPELEFVFRTLVDLRVDMDDLRREFEAYRRGGHLATGGAGPRSHAPREIPAHAHGEPEDRAEAEIQDVSFVEAAPGPPPTPASAPGPTRAEVTPPPDAGGVVVYRPGMTMEDLEREAIRAVLGSVDGNRRKAAELLGIGERTLYRKLARYDLES